MNEFLRTALDLAREAGGIMRKHFQVGVPAEIKADETPVTLADNKINSLVIAVLKKRYPHHSVLGEEQTREVENAEYVWVCDPIDGTMPYAMGVPTNLFALALVHKGQPVVAVAYDPYLDRMYTAEKGKGAFMNGRALSVNQTSTLRSASIGCSGPREFTFAKPDFVKDLLELHVRSYNFHCAIYEAMLVASGQFVGQVFAGKTAYDVAVTKLIVEEAGGKVTDLTGKEQRYDQPVHGVVASNGLLHKEILNLVTHHLKNKSDDSSP